MNDWRPIETKPRDHFPVLIWGPYGHRVAFLDVTWTWFTTDADDPLDYEPTHWMPLPLRPEEPNRERRLRSSTMGK